LCGQDTTTQHLTLVKRSQLFGGTERFDYACRFFPIL
jgi:hypothetical protein